MGLCTKLILLVITALAVFVGITIHSLLQVPPLPTLEDTWWGPEKPTKEDTSIKPFKIKIPDEVIGDLKKRLHEARPFVPPLEGIQQQYGMNTNLLKEIVEYWKTNYNWREREQFLNKYPQFTTNIQGLHIHFIHVKPAQTAGLQVVPLLMLHGWPGSVREFYEIIPLLTTPQKERNFVFEVIVPSLPGYGFSQAAAKPGMNPAHMAAVFKNLMKRLGFDKFYLQGGDWGAVIVSDMATLYPKNVLGVHSNICLVKTPLSFVKTFIGSFYPVFVVPKEHEHKMYPYSDKFMNFLIETGYAHIQSTKPDTVGVALNDSPVGLAAYILEKFTTLTNPKWIDRLDGGLILKYSYTDLLDNVMIYWVTGSITSSMRIYAESSSTAYFSLAMDRIPTNVPYACVRFPFEMLYQSDFILQEKFTNLVQSNDFEQGGHFAAFEEPELLANDVWSAIEKFRNIKSNKPQ